MSDEDVTTLPNESSIFATVVGITAPALAAPGWVVKTTVTGAPGVMVNELLLPLAVRPVAEAASV